MKIVSLHAENVKRLITVEIEPTGNMVQITGKNGQGKTSVLDAIWWALAGKDNIQKSPIRNGEEKALIRLDLGELVVTRRFTAQEDGGYTTSIIVENAEGARYQTPQAVLDGLMGHFSFDPLAFSRMKPEARVAALRSLVAGFDFDKAEADIKKLFDERTDRNREAKSAASRAASDVPENVPDDVDMGDLAKELQDAQRHNNEQERQKQKLDEADRGIELAITAIEEAKAKVAEEQAKLDAFRKERAEQLDPKELIDTAAIIAKMDAASGAQEAIQRAKDHKRAVAEAKTATEASEALTKQIEAIKAKAKTAIAEAKLPVEGISISEGDVCLAGVPFVQASDAEQLRASVSIAMAMNPKLRVIRVRDGSLLDEDALALMAKMSETEDYQIWIERVDSSGQIGVVMENGHVKGTEPKKATTSLFGQQDS